MRRFSFLAIAMLLLAAQSARADWTTATYFYASDPGSNSQPVVDPRMALSAPAAGGLYPVVNFVDPEGAGGPDDFGSRVAFPGNTGADDDQFLTYASGVLNVLTTGTYRFRTGSDDSSRVVLDGRNINVYNSCCGNNDSAGIVLTAGSTHSIQWNFKEGGGGANGTLSANLNGGAFKLFGSGQPSPDLTVNATLPGPAGPNGFIPGLIGKYYQTPGQPNQNSATDAFFAGVPTPAGTFTSTTINYHGAGTISSHLGADAGTLSAGGGNGTDDSAIALTGYIKIEAGDDQVLSTPGIEVTFRLDADDNARLSVAGLYVIENDGPHGTGHFYSDNTDTLASGTGDNAVGATLVSFPGPGLYPISLFYHNGAGGIDGQLFSSLGAGGGALITVGADRFFQAVPEPGSLALVGMGAAALAAACLRRRKAA